MMAGTSTAHAAYARESRVNEGGNDIQDQLFSLPNGEHATFLFHNFENADLTNRIFEHGGRITDDDDDADVILTISREEYISLKDKYAISRKTHVRLSGFVDRCINARRFQLAPIVEKGVPGRKLMSRRTEFTKDDDEHLCQYIAEVLPDKGESGRTGHFIYADLIRRADEFGQYKWAYRHPKDGWRERYRKNRDRMDKRIAQIVEKNPPPLDGKGRYIYRRYGKIDEDDELNADDDGLVELDEEERRDSATDNEDSPVQIKRANAQRQEEEEEEDGEGQVITHRPEASPNLRSRDAERQEEESTEEQAEEQQPEAYRTRSTTRQSRVSIGDAPGLKRRRTRASKTALEEPMIPDDILRGDTELDYEKSAEEPVPGPPPSNEAEIRKGKDKRSKAKTRRVVPPLSPRRTRARSRSLSIQREAVPGASRNTSRAKAKATAATAVTAALKPVPESQVFDEFVAHSDVEDEGEMHEVEANLQITAHSRESPADNQMHNGHGTEDLQTSRRVQSTAPSDVAIASPAGDDDDDDDDAELFAHAKRLSVHAPPIPAANLSRSGYRDSDRRSSSEEIFPSPGTRAGAEKKRRTQAAKAAPYVPPKGTRAASMIAKEQSRSRIMHQRNSEKTAPSKMMMGSTYESPSYLTYGTQPVIVSSVFDNSAFMVFFTCGVHITMVVL